MLLAALILAGLVTTPAVGVIASTSLRATDEKRRIHRNLAALANTASRPPGALFMRRANKNRATTRTFGGAMAKSCGCSTARLNLRRIKWAGRKVTIKAAPAGVRCASGSCAR